MASNQSRYHRFVAAICASLFVAADAHLSIPVTARRHALWRRPQAYARFLGIELSLAYKGPLLVVMPDGIGVSWPGHSSAAALASVSGVRVGLGGAAMLFGLDRRQRLGVLLPAVQKEFGLFANASIPNASIQYGRQVAFIGADANDTPGNARVFLREHHVSYPTHPTSTTDLGHYAIDAR